MRCIANVHYKIVRAPSDRKWWLPPEERSMSGAIVSLDCAFCEFKVLKRSISQPRSSTSGLGRYNRMRGIIVAHLHKHHKPELEEPTPLEVLLEKQGND